MQSIKSILSFFLISCENFNELTKNRLVLQRIWLTPYFNHLVLLDDKTKKLIFSCYEAKNPRALFIMGTYKYFLNQEVIEGKRLIEEAVAYGNFIATYIHGMLPMFIIQNFQKVTYAFGIWFTKQNDSMNIRCNEIATCNSFLNRP